MEWTWMHWIYLFFAVIHPISELIPATSLQRFLNLDYYPTKQENFPVKKPVGFGGSVLVLVFLALPPFNLGLALWYLALGFAFADLIQHATHLFWGKQKAAPVVHLITILLVCLLLLTILPSDLDFSAPKSWGWVLLGAFIIFGNWAQNSFRVSRRTSAPPSQGLSLQA